MTNVSETFKKLPPMCAAISTTGNVRPGGPTLEDTILIRRGEMGYHPFPGKDPEALNARWGVTTAQREAMIYGSCFGWHCPVADPDYWNSVVAEPNFSA